MMNSGLPACSDGQFGSCVPVWTLKHRPSENVPALPRIARGEPVPLPLSVRNSTHCEDIHASRVDHRLCRDLVGNRGLRPADPVASGRRFGARFVLGRHRKDRPDGLHTFQDPKRVEDQNRFQGLMSAPPRIGQPLTCINATSTNTLHIVHMLSFPRGVCGSPVSGSARSPGTNRRI